MPNARTVTPPTNTWSTRLARKTSSAILRTSSRLRLFCGMTQAPSEFDELESHLQRLAWSKPARPNRRNGKVAEPFFLAASLLPGSLHVGASPHAVLDDSSVRHEAILGTSDGPARTASETSAYDAIQTIRCEPSEAGYLGGLTDSFIDSSEVLRWTRCRWSLSSQSPGQASPRAVGTGNGREDSPVWDVDRPETIFSRSLPLSRLSSPPAT